jgi:hypothetical protein
MAELPPDPKGADLEDWVSAHFASRGCYVETTIKERNPDEILELDVVWTDYRKDSERRHPVEVKSGGWGLGDAFKFYGWTRYLGLEPGEFIHKQPCEHDPASLERVQKGTGIRFLHIAELKSADEHFKVFGLPEPQTGWLPPLWRFSFWARRRLVKALGVAITSGACPESAKATKKYLTLVNDAVFFIPDMRYRIEKLIETHFGHQQLARSAGYEIESKKVEFHNPPSTRTFARAYFDGLYFPVQACLYVEHRARLYIMKALVDYWIAKQRGELGERRKNVLSIGGKVIASQPVGITNAMEKGLATLSAAKSFQLFPIFWQTLLWSWGGFILNEYRDEEFAQLERETGVPAAEMPIALSAFDEIFPVRGGWFRNVDEGHRSVLILMPAAMRGLGAHRRKLSRAVKDFGDRKCAEPTKAALVNDNNALANLLDCEEKKLAG